MRRLMPVGAGLRLRRIAPPRPRLWRGCGWGGAPRHRAIDSGGVVAGARPRTAADRGCEDAAGALGEGAPYLHVLGYREAANLARHGHHALGRIDAPAARRSGASIDSRTGAGLGYCNGAAACAAPSIRA